VSFFALTRDCGTQFNLSFSFRALHLQNSMAAAQMSMSNENMLASAQQQPQKPFSSIETLLSLSTLFLNAQQQQQQQ
jgi:hypothetical protein